MAEQDGLDEGADDVFLVVVEVADGFEVEAEVVVGAAFVGVEDEAVGADGQRDGEAVRTVFDWNGGGDHQNWVAAATASRLRSIQDTVSSVAASMGIEVIASASALGATQAAGAQVYFQSAMIGAGYNSQTPGITTDRVVRDLLGSSTPGVGDVAAKRPLAGLPSGTYANAYTASDCQAGRSMGRERCYI